MTYAYCAEMICDDCAAAVIAELERDGHEETGDSDEWPGWCNSDESDCPEHCGHCGVFLENDLTADGADYVVQTVRDDLEAGCDDSIACSLWRDYYTWLDFPVWGVCAECGAEGFLNDDDVCEGACAREG